MTEIRLIDAAALEDVAGWERANSAKLLQAEILGDGRARAEVLPVAEVSWFVNVWNCKADLVLVTGEGERYADELLDLQPANLDALTASVISENGGGINMSGRYYPQSPESRQLFAWLMERAKAKGAS